MNKPVLAAMILALSTTFAMAAENANPADKAASDQPGTTGGATADPTAKADAPNANPADKTMKDQKTGSAGSTDMPNAKPDSGSVPKSQNEGNSGAQK